MRGGECQVCKVGLRISKTPPRSETTSYLTSLNKVKTAKTPGGHDLYWIKRESQNPSGEIGKDKPKDPTIKFSSDEEPVGFELEHSNREAGGEGTVPILVTPNGRSIPAQGTHLYANTFQHIPCYGGEGYLSVHNPYVAHPGEFSLAQIGLVHSDGKQVKQSLEAGWMKYPNLFGDWEPHLFVYYTTNGYIEDGDEKGGYNLEVKGWVQCSNKIYPGATLVGPSDEVGGSKYVMPIKYQLYEGKWWFWCKNEWIGYYPASLFGDTGLRSQADHIAFFGEVAPLLHSGPTRTAMGNGERPWPSQWLWHWPGLWQLERRWGRAAYMRNLGYQSEAEGGLLSYREGHKLKRKSDWPFGLVTYFHGQSEWGSYLKFGGHQIS